MKLTNTHSLVAALGLSLLAQGAWAQTATNAAPSTVTLPAAAPTSMPAIVPPMPQAAVPAANTAPGTSATASPRQAKHGEMAKHQQILLGKLNLSAAQKIQYDAMQAARHDLRKQMQANMVAHQKSMAEQISKDQMDPRAVIEADKQSRAILDTKRVAAEQKWLGFWDGLTQDQRKIFTADMKMRQEQHAQKPHRAPQG